MDSGDNTFALSLGELSDCIFEIAALGAGATRSLDAVCQDILGILNENLLRDENGNSSAALLRVFMTIPYANLGREARAHVEANSDGKPIEEQTMCLTLQGTIGDKPEWCAPELSKGHLAIPLIGAAEVQEIPMIARLLNQLGLEVHQVLEPDASLTLKLAEKRFNVFHVEEAKGSEYIPAQESFVVPSGIKSVVGLGSMMPTGHLCTVIVFSKQKISRETASMFSPLALGLSVAVLPCLTEKIVAGKLVSFTELENLQAQLRAREQLLGVFRDTVTEQSTRISGTMAELTERNDEISTTLSLLHEARDRLRRYEKGLATHYAKEKLGEIGTYTVALLVGTFINIYGHFLVPSLRGEGELWDRFVHELGDSPALTVCSLLLAYLFPIGVQVYAAVKSRIKNRTVEMDALFSSSTETD